MMYVLLLFALVAGEPQTLAGGPFSTKEECEAKLSEVSPQVALEKSVQAYGVACVAVQPTKTVSI